MSRPCRTCRTRKKACDKTRPRCKTCQLAGRQCLGYDTGRNQVFINLDSSNLKAPIKPLISQAISTSKRQHLAVRTIDSDPIFSLSLNTLDLSAGEFRSHFVTLWGNFHSLYARTPDVWSSGISSAGLQNRALDLALIALATMRLSLSPEDRENTYQAFSLSAYNASIQIFRRLLQDKSPTEKSKSMLVVITLVFTLFEAVQQRPTQICDSGWAGHLKGALVLIHMQGPEQFQVGALHEAFRKLREMAIIYLLSTSQTSFFSRSEWLTVPWKKIKRTHRDRLYDIAARLTSIYALFPSTAEPELRPENRKSNLTWRCQELYTDLLNWRTTWLQSEHPDILNSSPNLASECISRETNCPYFPNPRNFPTNEFSYLVAEWTALALLLHSMATRLSGSSSSGIIISDTGYPSPQSLSTTTSIGKTTSSSTAHFIPIQPPTSSEIHHLQKYLHSVLKLPCFGYSPFKFNEVGITEGRCRSLLPNWVLSNVRLDKTGCSADEDRNMDRDEWPGWSDAGWWGGLSDRLNFGVF